MSFVQLMKYRNDYQQQYLYKGQTNGNQDNSDNPRKKMIAELKDGQIWVFLVFFCEKVNFMHFLAKIHDFNFSQKKQQTTPTNFLACLGERQKLEQKVTFLLQAIEKLKMNDNLSFLSFTLSFTSFFSPFTCWPKGSERFMWKGGVRSKFKTH